VVQEIAKHYELHLATELWQLEAARLLLQEYGELRNHDAALGDYQHELLHLDQIYSQPSGCLLLATCEGQPAGCVAYRTFDAGIAEMKRLFVTPKFQGASLGKLLAQQIIVEARKNGFQKMYLDTHPRMKAAQQIYKELGFQSTSAYNQNPTPGIAYFQLQL